MQQTVNRTGGTDMSWARAVVLATGFFFIAVIFLGQIPAFFSLVFTQANLHTMSQSMLSLGLLSAGIALIALTASFLYDPKPVSGLFPPLFGLIGLGLMGLGTIGMLYVFISGHAYFPDQTVVHTANGLQTINWPDPSHGWFLNPYWFQPQSVDIGAVGFVLFVTGGGVLSYAALYFPYSRGRLTPVVTSFLTRLSLAVAGGFVLVYLTLYTFSANATTKSPLAGAPQNVLLGLALVLVLFALQVWLIPVMTAPGNRQKYMPNMYLHGVMLLGNVAVPLLVLFVAVYPVVNWAYNIHLSNDYWVQCAVKTSIPDSCTFTPYVGYIVAGVVASMLFSFMIAGGYLWTRKPGFVKLGSTFSFVFMALAVVAVHDTVSSETPIALVLGIGVAILGLVWTINTQREFVPLEVRQVSLGCTGQWLVWGTLLFIYLAGFAMFSFPTFLDTEQNLIIHQGPNAIHDAYWMLLIMMALGAMHFAFLTRRDALGGIRKLTLWLVLIGAGIQITGSIHFDLSNSANLANVLYYAGIVVEVLGIIVGWFGAFQTRGLAWILTSFATVFVGVAGALFTQSLATHADDVVVFFTIFMGLGAILYTIYGKDAPDPMLARAARQAQRLTPPPPATTAQPGLPE